MMTIIAKKKENCRNLCGKYFKQRFTQVFEYTKRTIELSFISGTRVSLLNKNKVTFGMSRCLFLLTGPPFPDLPCSPLTFSPFSSPVPVPQESKYQVTKPVHRNETESNLVVKQTQLFFNQVICKLCCLLHYQRFHNYPFSKPIRYIQVFTSLYR